MSQYGPKCSNDPPTKDFFACLVSILKKGAMPLHENFPISATFKRKSIAWENLKEILGSI